MPDQLRDHPVIQLPAAPPLQPLGEGRKGGEGRKRETQKGGGKKESEVRRQGKARG